MKKGWVIVLFFIFFIGSCPVYAQKIIRGKVSDAETGKILQSAHIRVVGKRSGTISNDEGRYFLGISEVPAEIIVSYIGYKSQKIAVTEDSPGELDIVLVPSPVVLETIVGTAEDQALRIMRKVISRKQKWRASLESTTADAYTRVILANDKSISSISESISEVFWDSEKGFRELIKSKHQTKNMKSKNNFASARIIPNLYDDDIDIIGFDTIGPTHPKALTYYDFKLIRQRKLDDKTVFDISFKPKGKLQPAFIGTVAILDEEFAMIEVDVKPNDAIKLPSPLNKFSFSIAQQFSNFGKEYWLPVDARIDGEIKIKLPGLEFPTIKYRQLTRLTDYRVNVSLPDSLYDSDKKMYDLTISNKAVTVEEHVDDSGVDASIAEATEVDTPSPEPNAKDFDADAPETVETETAEAETDGTETDRVAVVNSAVNDPDSLFAASSQVIPLTVEEKKAYDTIDSTMTMEKAFKPKGFLTRMIKDDAEKKQKKQSKFTKAFSRVFSGFGPRVWHNRVDGFNMGLNYKNRITDRIR
ncbi:MAG: carboxypeptidase-like regulatory domain-containing protein, partial [Candidatus Latescibacteria bacterium]|nr:carboxypeptidase-like regulatory domain-containing protein [Candidatus Latescibacterota bacterium]